MIRPRPFCLAIFGLLTFLWVVLEGSQLWNDIPIFAYIFLLTSISIFILDALSLFIPLQLKVSRIFENSMALDTNNQILLKFHYSGKRPLHFEVFDHYPTEHLCEGLPCQVKCLPNQSVDINYSLHVINRGLYHFESCELKVYSVLSLWSKRFLINKNLDNKLKVYPNYSEFVKFGLLAAEHRLNEMGVHRQRQRGTGLEFRQLRDFRSGDNLARIDWKASSRYHKLISRDYDIQRNQQIVILLDCSKNMLDHSQGISHFDSVLNAVLLLVGVILKNGDACSIMTYGSNDRWLPPSRGPETMQQVLEFLYDLKSNYVCGDVLKTVQSLDQRLNKRSMVIHITCVKEEESQELSLAYKLLAKRHLPLLVSLDEMTLNDNLDHTIESFFEALRYAGTIELLDSRERFFEALKLENIRYIKTNPKGLSLNIVNQYLDIKASSAL